MGKITREIVERIDMYKNTKRANRCRSFWQIVCSLTVGLSEAIPHYILTRERVMRLGAPSLYVDVFVNGNIHIGCQKNIRERAFYQILMPSFTRYFTWVSRFQKMCNYIKNQRIVPSSKKGTDIIGCLMGTNRDHNGCVTR